MAQQDSAVIESADDVTDLTEVKIRSAMDEHSSRLKAEGVVFEDVSSDQLRIERLKEKYDLVGTSRFDSAIDELAILEDSALNDQQVLIQGSPQDRDMKAFGDAAIRDGRRKQIIRSFDV